MKAAIYVRVSSEDQAKEGYSVRGQIDRLKGFVKSQGWTIYHIYTDEGYSAKNLNRPAMDAMMKDVTQGYFDVVLVYKLDRLVRSVVDLHELLSLFDDNKVSFKSATEMFDTTTATGRMFITLVATLAQWERELLSERTVFGMERKFKEGQRNGGSAPFGYDLDENNQLIINEDEAKWIKWMFSEAQIKGKKALAKDLNRNGIRTKKGLQWSPGMIDYILTNPVYHGQLRWKYRTKAGNRTYEEILTPGSHEPIISEETYKAVKMHRKERKGTKMKGHSIYPFSGILQCKRCGSNMVGSKRKRKDGSIYRFHKCNGRFMRGVCDMPIIGEDVLEDEFLKQLEYVDIQVDPPEEEGESREDIEKEIKRVQKRMERMKELYMDGDIDKRQYREKMDEEKEKESALMQTLNAANETVNPDEIMKLIGSLKSNWSEIERGEKKKIIHTLFDRITIECHNTHKGGAGQRANIEIVDYSMK